MKFLVTATAGLDNSLISCALVELPPELRLQLQKRRGAFLAEKGADPELVSHHYQGFARFYQARAADTLLSELDLNLPRPRDPGSLNWKELYCRDGLVRLPDAGLPERVAAPWEEHGVAFIRLCLDGDRFWFEALDGNDRKIWTESIPFAAIT